MTMQPTSPYSQANPGGVSSVLSHSHPEVPSTESLMMAALLPVTSECVDRIGLPKEAARGRVEER